MEKKIHKIKDSKEDVRHLLLHLESEYRKANISEKQYKELKEKYQRILKDNKKIKEQSSEKKLHKHPTVKEHEIHKEEPAKVEEKTEETKPEEIEAEEHLKQIEEEAKKEMTQPVNEEKKGIFKSLFGRKKELEKPEEKPVETKKEEKEIENKEGDEEVPKVEEKPEKKGGFFKSILSKKKEEIKTEEKTEAPEEEPEEETEEKEESDEESDKDPPKKNAKKEKEEEITEITPEVIERLAQQAKEQSEEKPEEEKSEKKKGGFFKSILGKKKEEPEEKKEAEPQQTGATQQAETKNEVQNTEVSEPRESKSATSNYDVEIEKLKVMLDSVKETSHVTDESIRNVSEGVGEIRSMVFQADAELKENAIKMEKIEDEISEIKPQEIAKKLREFGETFEKHQLQLEMLDKKSADASEKINKVLEMLKAIGGIENLINVNKEVQKKLEDINEAMKYIERIGTKTEKMFIDLNKGLQDLIFIKAKQDDFNESLKDIIKNIDGLNVKFESYITKKDLDSFKEDDALIKKQIEDIKKILPVADLKLPESLVNLRKEREDISLFLDSLEDQYANGKILKLEYENIKSANMRRLEEIRTKIEGEWKKVEEMLKAPEKVETASQEVEKIEGEKKAEEETGEETPVEGEKAEEIKPEKKAGLLGSIFSKKKKEETVQPSEAQQPQQVEAPVEEKIVETETKPKTKEKKAIKKEIKTKPKPKIKPKIKPKAKAVVKKHKVKPVTKKINKVKKKPKSKTIIKQVKKKPNVTKVKKPIKKIKTKRPVKKVKKTKEVVNAGEERKKEILSELKNLS